MNHKITVKNLGPIDSIKDLEISKVNLLIGKSASGKSVLAKAIYFFNFLFIEYGFPFSTMRRDKLLNDHVVSLLSEFFPEYSEYAIRYKYTNGMFISVKWQNGAPLVNFSSALRKKIERFQQEIDDLRSAGEIKRLQELLAKYQAKNEKTKKFNLSELDIDETLFTKNVATIENSLRKELGILRTIFIPATRNLVTDFDRGRLRMLNRYRPSYRRDLSAFMSAGDTILKFFSEKYDDIRDNFKRVDDRFRSIIKGDLIKKDGSWMLIAEGKRPQILPLNRLSSGQKASIPIVMFLQSIADEKSEALLIIEEPEAHLFPTDQYDLLKEIISTVNDTNSKVFITTHSPYLLMGINNVIKAEERGYKKLQKISVSLDDMQLHKLEKETNKSIKDEEERLVDGSYIDIAIDQVMEDFEAIIEGR